METPQKIPFAIEMSRVIELLASQIYPSPFALLRENVQNSFDAILLRKHLGQSFEPKIDVVIEAGKIKVTDNGIGMSREELRTHFWRAGSSSKNNDNARAAGVVGTFGIGAMANFGVAERLVVTTESASTGERTRCEASRSTLSVTEDCISFHTEAPTGGPGTEVLAEMQAGKATDVRQATDYISGFVKYVSVPVTVNGRLVSQVPVENAVAKLAETWKHSAENAELGGGLRADVLLTGAITGEVRVDLARISLGGSEIPGRLILRQGFGPLQTFRSQFGLAAAGISSVYHFGGMADFNFLQPTAGREALTTESLQMLQRIVTPIDSFVSEHLANRPESNANACFVQWAAQHRRYDLCGNLRVRIEPGDSITLANLRERNDGKPILVYGGNDATTTQHASEERPVVLISRGSPRRECEHAYMRKYCRMEELSDEPKVLKEKPAAEFSMAESGLAFRISSILSQDYFLDAEVKFGKISHGIPLLILKKKPAVIYIDLASSSAKVMLEIYDKEYVAFGHMAKDFVRTHIFPKVADLVPSATRQGAEAFLKSIQRNREVFEYETTDLENLTNLWQDYLSGRLPMHLAAERSEVIVRKSYQILDSAAASRVRDIVPDVIANERAIAGAEGAAEPGAGPAPSIQRLDIATDFKVLTIPADEMDLKGYRCFLAITDKIRDQKGDFFLQPHRTSVVWGGQKVLFVFEHQSGEFGLYYDIQTQGLISPESGGGTFVTCTIVMKNRVFIPIPAKIEGSFIPRTGEKKRLEVRCDILHIEK